MRQASLVAEAREYARTELTGEATGHDFHHVERVARLAGRLALAEHARVELCLLIAYLHDVADYKIAGSDEVGLAKLERWFAQEQVEASLRQSVVEMIAVIGFRGGHRPPPTTLEGRVVQDADRLDAMGAIGIGRAFAYGGSKGFPIHDPELTPRVRMSEDEYRAGSRATINHFYEKLLRLRDHMNTETGRRLAEERHRFMLEFLERFLSEWECDDGEGYA